ncbi:MAG: hypothetical protein JSW51_01660 [Gemmatimonadota bacterium]|nr:MAG: hypothetical protein JSW51_01660 [Gemmatimonadota bacterium]
MRRVLAISVFLLAAGCVSTKVELLDQSVRPAVSPDSVSILAEEPDQPYHVIAVVKATGASAFDSFDDLRERLIIEAAILGGDAVIVGTESKSSTPIFNTVGFVMSERKQLEGEVIAFDREAAQR